VPARFADTRHAGVVRQARRVSKTTRRRRRPTSSPRRATRCWRSPTRARRLPAISSTARSRAVALVRAPLRRAARRGRRLGGSGPLGLETGRAGQQRPGGLAFADDRATDALRTGTYSKTLTFTLSTTSP
jgi:hypothetical protein